MSNPESPTKFNETEKKILEMREAGEKIDAIAVKLHMSYGTVQNNLNRIAARFGFDDLRGIAREEKFKELVYPLLHPQEPPPEPIKIPEETIEKPKKNYIWYIVGGILALGIVIGGLWLGYWLTSGQTPPPDPPTATYIPQEQDVELTPGVIIHLVGYLNPAQCPEIGDDIIVSFYVRNNSENNALLTFDALGYAVQDDKGNNYFLKQIIDTSECGGTGSTSQLLQSGETGIITVVLQGPLPPDVSYLNITLNSVSGVSPLVFRLGL